MPAESIESHAEQAAVRHAMSRGYVQPAQVQEAARQRDEALARGQPSSLLAILSTRFLAPEQTRELTAVYQQLLRGSGQGSIDAPTGGPGRTVQLPPRRPSDRVTAVEHPSRTQIETPTDSGLAHSGAQMTATLPSGKGGGGSLEEIGGYRIVKELARGGMGVVYVAEKPGLDRKVAVKVLINAELAADEDIERFKIEAQATARLKHEGLVTVYDVGEDRGRPFIVMELVEGESLKARLLREGPLKAKHAAELTQKLAKAIYYAHKRHILHRDLKPSNVLLGTDGEPKITDFGLAKDMRKSESGERGLTMTGDVMGTPAYMPPEQATGELDQIDRRSDVYSLGATLYEMLTGRPPFEGSTPMRILSSVMVDDPTPPGILHPNLDKDLETICLKCLEKRPGDRYLSARALADDLGLFLAKRPIRARPPTTRERIDKWFQRNRGLAVAISALLVLGGVLSVGAAYWLGQRQQADRDAQARAAEESSRAAGEAAATAQRQARQDMIEAARQATAEALEALEAAAPEPLEARLGLALTLLQASSRWDALANDTRGESLSDEAARAGAQDAARRLGEVAFEAGAWSLAEAAYAQLPAEPHREASARVEQARAIEKLLDSADADRTPAERDAFLAEVAAAIGALPIGDVLPLILRRLEEAAARVRADRDYILTFYAERQQMDVSLIRQALAEDAERPLAERLVAFHPKWQPELREILEPIATGPSPEDPFDHVGQNTRPQLQQAGLACVQALAELPADGPLTPQQAEAVRAGILEFLDARWASRPWHAAVVTALERCGGLQLYEAALQARQDRSYYGGTPRVAVTPPAPQTPRRSVDDFLRAILQARRARDLEGAMDLLGQGLRQHPANVELLLEQVVILGEAGQVDGALRACQTTLDAHPNESRAYKYRGITLARAGRAEEAIDDLTRALELKPDDTYPLLLRGQLLAELGEQQAARRDLEAYLRQAPADEPNRQRAEDELRRLR